MAVQPKLDQNVIFMLIEAKLVINGYITTNDLYRHIGISRASASRAIQQYLSEYPHSMAYVPSKKRYVADEEFMPTELMLFGHKAGEFLDSIMMVYGLFKGDRDAKKED